MSIPNFPEDIVKISWEQALSMVVASIAMEELALSHILNAEGEKLQYVLGTLHKNQPCPASTSEILKVNESIGSILDKVETNQILLKAKLEQAIKANQKPAVKTTLYHGAPGFCWCRGQALPWLHDDFPEQANVLDGSSARIPLPSGKSILASYSFSVELTTGERNISILLRQQVGSNWETITVEGTHLCCKGTVANLSGCVVISPIWCECGQRELECTLSTPCCATVKRAAFTVTEL